MQFNNVTDAYFNLSDNGGQEEEADPRILARSLLMYKIGRSAFLNILLILLFFSYWPCQLTIVEGIQYI